MNKKNLLLWALIGVITLPIFLTFSAAVAWDGEDDTYAEASVNMPEEETENEESKFEKEKNILSIAFTLSNIYFLLEKRSDLFHTADTRNGIAQLPYNPPEFI